MVAPFVRQIGERALLLPERFYLPEQFTAQRWRQSGMDIASKHQLGENLTALTMVTCACWATGRNSALITAGTEFLSPTRSRRR
jgi:hypothetical protein